MPDDTVRKEAWRMEDLIALAFIAAQFVPAVRTVEWFVLRVVFVMFGLRSREAW